MGLWNRLIGAPDRDQFIAEAIARMRSLAGDCAFDAESFSVRAGGHTVYLATYWSEYQRAKSGDRAAVLGKLIANAGDLESSTAAVKLEQIRAQLRPMVHDRIYWSASRLKLKASGRSAKDYIPMCARCRRT